MVDLAATPTSAALKPALPAASQAAMKDYEVRLEY